MEGIAKKLHVDEKGYGTGELMVIFVGLAGLALTVFSFLGNMFMGSEEGEAVGGILGGVADRLKEVIEGVAASE